jgi:hypothetical protein
LAGNDSVFLNKSTSLHLGKSIKIAPTKVTTTHVCKHIYAVMLNFTKNIASYGLIKTDKKLTQINSIIDKITRSVSPVASRILPQIMTYNKTGKH